MERGMPPKRAAKSIDDFTKLIAEYELICDTLHKKLVKILKYSFASRVIKDFENVVRIQTLLKINIIPRDISIIDTINERYSMLYNDKKKVC